MSYSTSITHIVKNALRAAGYDEDSKQVLDARIMAVREQGPVSIKCMVYFNADVSDIAHGIVYLSMDAHNQWTAEY